MFITPSSSLLKRTVKQIHNKTIAHCVSKTRCIPERQMSQYDKNNLLLQ